MFASFSTLEVATVRAGKPLTKPGTTFTAAERSVLAYGLPFEAIQERWQEVLALQAQQHVSARQEAQLSRAEKLASKIAVPAPNQVIALNRPVVCRVDQLARQLKDIRIARASYDNFADRRERMQTQLEQAAQQVAAAARWSGLAGMPAQVLKPLVTRKAFFCPSQSNNWCQLLIKSSTIEHICCFQ